MSSAHKKKVAFLVGSEDQQTSLVAAAVEPGAGRTSASVPSAHKEKMDVEVIDLTTPEHESAKSRVRYERTRLKQYADYADEVKRNPSLAYEDAIEAPPPLKLIREVTEVSGGVSSGVNNKRKGDWGALPANKKSGSFFVAFVYSAEGGKFEENDASIGIACVTRFQSDDDDHEYRVNYVMVPAEVTSRTMMLGSLFTREPQNSLEYLVKDSIFLYEGIEFYKG
jgi:hypothetical protein